MYNNKLEEERRARMARLRAENEHEERQIAAALDQDLSNEAAKKKKGPQEQIFEVNPEELEEMDEEEQMRALLGFTSGFGSTKGQKVEDNHTTSAKGAASKNKARKYRQYMNRKHGFNRPLDKMD
jgi:U4/U6.U5 tri-snRNP-associated protein 3